MSKIMGPCLALGLVLTSCSDRGDWTGQWIGRRPVTAVPGQDPSVAQTMALVRLTIKNDGSFVLTEEGFGKQGSGSFGSDTATIEVREVEGLPSRETQEMMGKRRLKLKKDGTMEFVREGDPPVVLGRRPVD